MKYYDEAKTERIIRRKAMLSTFIVIFLIASAVLFVSSESAREIIPDQVKEWFKEDGSSKEVKPEKKVVKPKKKNRA